MYDEIGWKRLESDEKDWNRPETSLNKAEIGWNSPEYAGIC